MGVVFKAEDKKLGKDIALKLVARDVSDKDIVRFQNEAKTIAKLRHPNIVDVYDFGYSDENESQLFIAMEFIDGQSLAELIEENERISYLDLVPIIVQILDGLANAHNNGVLHRDIKPSNIMLLPTEKEEGYFVKIVDFGLAKTSIEEQKLTETGVPIGTPNYISPEQVQGKEIDQRADLYSLGCLVYKGLTGRLPFTGGDALSTAALRLYKDPPPFCEIDDSLDCPIEIEKIVMKSLGRQPAKRYSSAAQFKESLVSYFAQIDHLKTLGIEKFEPEGFPWKIVAVVSAITVPLVSYMVSTMFFSYTDSLNKVSLPSKSFGKEALSRDTANFSFDNGKKVENIDLSKSDLNERTLQMFDPHNKRIRLTNTPISDKYVERISQKCKQLIELRIIGTTEKVSPEAYNQLARLKKLKVLEYENMNADRGFLKMVSQLPLLEELNIAYNDGITSSDLPSMGGMTNLKKLTLGWKKNSEKPWRINELVQFVNARKHIEVLILKTDFESMNNWKKLLNLTNINALDLSDCSGVSLEVVDSLAKIPQIKKLYFSASEFNQSDTERLKSRYPDIEFIANQRGASES